MTRPVQVGEHIWRHCCEWSALVAVAAWLAAALLPVTVPIWSTTGFCFVAGVAAMFVTWAHTGHDDAALYMGGWGFVLTGWMTAARLEGAWHVAIIFAIVITSLVMTSIGVAVFGRLARDLHAAAGREQARENEKELRYWERVFALYGAANVVVLEVEKTGSGRKVIGRLGKAAKGLPAVSFNKLAGLSIAIAAHRRLPEDAVYFEKGETAADFTMHIREKKQRRTPIFLPAENLPISITRPFAIGQSADEREFMILLREIHMLIVGATGSGKSNLLNVLIAQLSRCMDCVIFMIDAKGGSTARAWVAPWAKGMCSRPVIDWVATTRAEAKVMLDALNAAVQYRSKHRTREKIVPDVNQPALVLITDEGAFVFGHQKKATTQTSGDSSAQLAAAGQDFVEMARSEAGVFVGAGVRGNVDTWGSTGIKSQCKYRVGMAVSTAEEGRSVFPDDPRAAATLSRIRQPGDGLVLDTRKGHKVSPPLTFYRLTDGSQDEETGEETEDMITPIALETGDTIRPALDDGTARAMGEAYAERWYRQHGKDLVDLWKGAAPERTGDAEFDAVIAALDEDDEESVDPRQVRMREILQQRGRQGATVKKLMAIMLAEGKGARRETIHHWLARDRKRGLVVHGSYHRWKWHTFADEAELTVQDDDDLAEEG